MERCNNEMKLLEELKYLKPALYERVPFLSQATLRSPSELPLLIMGGLCL